MQKIPAHILQKAITEAETLHIQDKALVMQRIEQMQPVLFESVAIQRQLNHDPNNIQLLFDILLVLQLALDHAGIELQPISQNLYIAELNKFSQQLSFSAGLTRIQHQQAMQQYFQSHKEPALLNWAQQTMAQAGVADMGRSESKQLTVAAMTLVNCIAIANVYER